MTREFLVRKRLFLLILCIVVNFAVFALSLAVAPVSPGGLFPRVLGFLIGGLLACLLAIAFVTMKQTTHADALASNDVGTLQEMEHGFTKMGERLESLETILSDHPNAPHTKSDDTSNAGTGDQR